MAKGPFDTLDNAPTEDGRGQEGSLLAGRYRIVHKLGEGGMGMVYLAEDIELANHKVAVKFIPPTLAGNARALKNLKREALTAMRLTHPNIVRLHDLHTDGHQKFLVMEYVAGKTLDDLLAERDGERLPPEELLPIAEQTAAALDYAHSQNILHRDLKPSNIMVGEDGTVRLLDFGVAREMKDSYTRVTGQETSGTLPYMSPEQLMGERPSVAMDVYSFGAVLYECLAGHPPFYQGDIREQIKAKAPQPIENAARHVNDAILLALSKDRGRRPCLAGQVVALLRGAGLDPANGPPETSQVQVGERPVIQMKRAILPEDLVEVTDAVCESLYGLAAGSREAQGLQRRAVAELERPLEVQTRRTGIALRLIPTGTFLMGSPSGESGRSDDEVQHRVILTRPYYCGKSQVTQGQWRKVCGDNPSHFQAGLVLEKGGFLGMRKRLSDDTSDWPVEMVSWQDCELFLQRLCQLEVVAEGTYRLLTEAEWEYACRAGTQTALCDGDLFSATGRCRNLSEVGWYHGNSGGRTHAVGRKKANAFGLYDMHGNVWEWCQDWYGEYSSGLATDPLGPASGDSRVLRGGGWFGIARDCRSADRAGSAPVNRRDDLGLRLARTMASYP